MPDSPYRAGKLLFLTLLFAAAALAQQRAVHLEIASSGASAGMPQATPNRSALSNYILGPDDQITLHALDLEEISNKVMRIDMRGDLNIPLVGRVHAAGLTADQLETEIENRMKKYLKHPQVVVGITEFRSQPISILGEVGSPGVRQLSGHKTLFEVLSEAGGLRPDAGSTVKITRNLRWGAILLPDAKEDPTGQFSVASISSKSIMNATNPAENIAIMPEDVISIPKADLVYCIGSVKKAGGFVLGQQETMSALQILSLAEGLDKNAAPDKAKIMRIVPGSATRTEIPVNLKRLMAGKAPDLSLKSDDILFVPNSAAKSALTRTAEAAVQIGTGVAIYTR